MPESKSRAALLLIHGIGEQSPYETLDAFAQGLVRYGFQGKSAARLEPKLMALPSGSRAAIRLKLEPFASLDLYEFYWADLVQGKLRAPQAFYWLLRTGLVPLNFAQQLPLSADQQETRLGIVFREIYQAILLLVVLVFLMAVALWALVRLEPFLKGLYAFLQELSFERVVALAAVLIPGLTLLSLGRSILSSEGLVRRLRLEHHNQAKPWLGMNQERFATLKPYLLAAMLVLALLVVVSVLVFYPQLSDLGTQLQKTISGNSLELLGFLLATLLIYLGKWLLETYVADIILYVTADQKSSHYQTRQDIKTKGTAILKDLLLFQDRLEPGFEYDKVFIAGHSLGSVIAYDCLNDLSRKARLDTGLPILKLRGLLTFGSPLDKVHYFFREEVKDHQAIRAQMLSFLHATLKKSSSRDYGPYRFEPYHVPFKWLNWENVYGSADLISNELRYYQLSQQHDMGFKNPFSAHNDYWRARRFYEIVLDWLEREKS